MAVRDDQDVTLRRVGVLETGAVVFLLDVGDERVEAADDVVGGSARYS